MLNGRSEINDFEEKIVSPAYPTFLHILKKFFCKRALILPGVVTL